MKFFPMLFKALAALGAPIAIMVAGKLVEVFSGPAPSDVSGGLWLIISGVAVFVLNFLISKLPRPSA